MGNKYSNDEAAAAGSYLAASDKEKEGKRFPPQFSFSACLHLWGSVRKMYLKHEKFCLPLIDELALKSELN